MSTQLDRIEAKLDILLSQLPARECSRTDIHLHGPGPFEFRPLLPGEEPYETCYRDCDLVTDPTGRPIPLRAQGPT